ncbi:MAG: PTS system mannose/fructose/sorbose family transporter subunit IID [Erysipelotrichaceae bacterium]|nr:PTS system mannose/fructose/sorbose family transporter subunit IID [Erysipelotrichaceae bacterium]
MDQLTFSVLEAAFVALVYYFLTSEWLSRVMPFYLTTSQPIFLGMVFGWFFGNLPAGIVMGGTLELLYIANNQPGANISQDEVLACCISMPIALKFGLSNEVAMTLAIPFGILGVPLDNLCRLAMGVWTRRAEKHIDQLNFPALKFDCLWGPALMRIPFRFLPVFLLILIGGNAAEGIVNAIPDVLMRAITNIGGLLPALGLILCLRFIGRAELLVYYIVGFVLVKMTGWNAFVLGIFAACLAYLHYTFVKNDPEYNLAVADEGDGFADDGFGEPTEEAGEKVRSPYKGGLGILSRKHHLIWPWKVPMLFRTTQSLEYFFATGYLNCMIPILRELYANDEEALKEALHRHNEPFVCTFNWADLIWGAVIAMEEKKSVGEDIPGEAISALKTGLMGPLAGIGDTINWGCIKPLVRMAGATAALAGSLTGQFAWLGLGIFLTVTEYIFYDLGYRLGADSIIKLVSSGKANLIIMVAGVLGATMLGVMVANNAKLNLAIVLTSGEVVRNLNDVINGVLPGLLLLIYSIVVFFYLLKDGKYTRVLLVTIIGVIVLTLIGVM